MGVNADGPALTVKLRTLCPGCVVDIQTRYDQLPDLGLALAALKGGSMKVAYQSKVTGTKEPAVPLNLHVVVLLNDIDELVSLVEGYRIQDLMAQPSKEYHVWIKGSEQRVFLDGVDRALRVRRVHQRVSDTVGLAPLFQRRLAPCWDCGRPTLGTWGGSGVIECTNDGCEFRCSIDSYERRCLEGLR